MMQFEEEIPNQAESSQLRIHNEEIYRLLHLLLLKWVIRFPAA